VKPLSAIFSSLLLLTFVSGCASVSSTSIHYLSLTPEAYPPKDKDAVIPLLAEKPDRTFKPIGRFQWETPRDWRFIRRSLEYNARVNGADAILLKDRESFHETVLTDVPPSVQMIPVTRYIAVPYGGKRGGWRWVPVIRYQPFIRPGYVDERVTHWNIVDAEMIIFPDRTKPLQANSTATN